ncbi:FG-GAP repeat domain-containing protein [Planktotalea sp.]|uniref:FG-GAP repeat domain-containing protein n=1 Tax=Planktotalea sp. TaxID=2029877 RepID=UPI003D6C521A
MRFAALVIAIACAANSVDAGVVEAKYTEPTTRYAHGVLGDAIEYGALSIETDAGNTLTLRLPETRVFEDLAPRLFDVDLDGDNEVIVVETSIRQGARLAIYDETGLIAATPYIGRTHRWLAPVGAADFDGDGFVEIAYVDRPHLAKTLRIWRFERGQLVHLADQTGLTNHKIGDDFISGGVRSCEGQSEIITADANWSKIVATTYQNQRFSMEAVGSYTGPASMTKALLCE